MSYLLFPVTASVEEHGLSFPFAVLNLDALDSVNIYRKRAELVKASLLGVAPDEVRWFQYSLAYYDMWLDEYDFWDELVNGSLVIVETLPPKIVNASDDIEERERLIYTELDEIALGPSHPELVRWYCCLDNTSLGLETHELNLDAMDQIKRFPGNKLEEHDEDRDSSSGEAAI